MKVKSELGGSNVGFAQKELQVCLNFLCGCSASNVGFAGLFDVANSISRASIGCNLKPKKSKNPNPKLGILITKSDIKNTKSIVSERERPDQRWRWRPRRRRLWAGGHDSVEAAEAMGWRRRGGCDGAGSGGGNVEEAEATTRR